jgi:two-component system nitrate/nitrite response regulator NarL
MIRVFIVAEVRLYRDGLAQHLGRNGRIEVVGSGCEALAAMEEIERSAPDIVLLDYGSGLAAESIRAIVARSNARVLLLGIPNSEAAVVECVEAGASGFVTRDDPLDAFETIVESVARGEILCSPRITAAFARRLANLAADTPRARTRLTPRQREIVALIDQGYSNKAIAETLSIELATVKNHVHNILEKMQVRRRGEAASQIQHAR